jgi:hypothetical protein
MTQEEKLNKILEGQTRLEERQLGIGQSVQHIKQRLEDMDKTGCRVGVEHATRLKTIEQQTDDQWKRINDLARPTRTAALTAGGVGAGMGTLIIALREFGPALMRVLQGG